MIKIKIEVQQFDKYTKFETSIMPMNVNEEVSLSKEIIKDLYDTR